MRRAPPVVPVRGSDTDRRKPRTEFLPFFAPGNLFPCRLRQSDGQLSGADRLMILSRCSSFGGRPIFCLGWAGNGVWPGSQTFAED